MGMFDDLIPAQPGAEAPPKRVYITSPAAPAAISFDDLIPKPSASDTAVDVAKSLGTGVVKGAAGAAGSIGDLSDIGAKGLEWLSNFASDSLGIDRYQRPSEPSALNAIPTGARVLKAVEDNVGRLPEPKTTAGHYAESVGEFVPMVLGGPGSIARRVLTQAVVPGVASEGAAQGAKALGLSDKAQGYARMAGAITAPFALAGARRAVTPNAIAPERQALVDTLHNEGVTDLTAGQRTGSKPLQWFESSMSDLPFAGGRAAEMAANQAEQFTAAALRRVGENAAARATPEVIDRNFGRIGQNFDGLAARNTLEMDRPFATGLVDSVREYNSLVPQSMRSPMVENVVNDIAQHAGQNAGQIAGDFYQSLRSRLERAARTSAADPQLSEALRGIRGALDDAMERSITRNNPGDLGGWQQARREYRNMLTIEKAATGAGSNAAEGLISPSHLRNATVQQGRRAYARGQGDFADLARAGEAIMKPLPQSGTAPRAFAAALPTAVTAIGSGMMGVAPPAAAALAALSLAGPPLAGRAVMSRPVQAWLGNQALGPGPAAIPQAIGNGLLSNQLRLLEEAKKAKRPN